MKIICILFLTMVLSFFSIAPPTFALPYHYSITGAATVDGYGSLDITGEMYIDSLTIYEDGHTAVFTYGISSFDVNIGSLSFDASGEINSIYYGDPDPNVGFTSTFDWFELSGEGDWTTWRFLSYAATFYYEDGTAFDKGPDPADYYNIPYMISFSDGYDGLYIDSMVMTRTSEPIPEPASLMLLFTGIIGLAGSRLTQRVKKI